MSWSLKDYWLLGTLRVRWIRAPWIVPKSFTSFVPLPRTVISKRKREDCSLRHQLHELAHVLQIKRDGYVRRMITYLWRALKFGYKRHPDEREADNFVASVFALYTFRDGSGRVDEKAIRYILDDVFFR
jgi:hypothetical protein